MYIIKYKDYCSMRFELNGLNSKCFGTFSFTASYTDYFYELSKLKKCNIPLDEDYIIFDLSTLMCCFHFNKKP